MARTYGVIMALRREIDRPISAPDGQVAAIARANSLGVATRDARDFEDCGMEVINPFPFSG